MKTKQMEERRRGTPRAWIARDRRLPLVIASLACTLAHADTDATASPTRHLSSKEMGLNIDIQGGGWGGAPKESIETVLYAVADELMSHLPKKLTVPIVVSHTNGNPVALYDRGPAGEYQIHLHASGEYWHLYVYEFAHELCHILSNHDQNIGPDTIKYNQWFEETLCETASLFTLKNLAATWEATPPARKWSQEAKNLRRFFEHLIAEGHRQLPPNTPLASWLQNNEKRLRNDPYRRAENEVVSNLLLPLFQENPQNWEALNYLNLDPSDARNSLNEYLHDWYENAPPEHKKFVGGVLAMLMLDKVMPPSDLSAQKPAVLAALANDTSR